MTRFFSWKAVLVVMVTMGLLCAGGAMLVRTAAGSTAPQDTAVVLRLNIPAFRLQLIEHGVVTATYEVAVGERRYQTPLGAFQVTHVTWNPWWYPPRSEWAQNDTVHPPGDLNPMGPIKLRFGGLYFLHGTPFESSIGKASSHGCVRMRPADAASLGRALNRLAGGGLPDDTIDALEADSTRTVTIELLEPVPIDVGYVTVEVDAGRLYVHRDIYRRDPPTGDRALEVLAMAGYDVALVDRQRLNRLVRRARSRSTSVALDSLIASPAVAGARGPAVTPSPDRAPARPSLPGARSDGSPGQSRSEGSPAATTSCSEDGARVRALREPGWPGS
ncbi:MAG TPA: L,D-transpeptidase [Gemmatimonadaceae bacterium]|jgi:hypothetical protein